MTAIRTADQALTALLAALADLADAEGRFAAIREQGRARRPDLAPAVADIRYRDTPQMRQAMEDWGTAHSRIQSYGAAATALLLAESRRRARALNVTTPMDDERDWHPAMPTTPYDGWPVNTARRPR